MRKWITLLMTMLVGSTASYANIGQVTLEAGYRHDNLSWKNSFPSSDPVVSTNTRFKDVDIFQLGLNGRTNLGCNFYVRANAYFGWVLDGDFEQNVSTYAFGGSDYNSNGGGFGFSAERKSLLDDRYVYGVGAAIGYPFYFCDCSMALAPVLGYAIDEQTFTVDDHGFGYSQHSGNLIPNSGSGCCTQKFLSRWYGPFFGVDFLYQPHCQCWDLYAALEYHWGHFTGKHGHDNNFAFGDNGRRHSKKATGWVFNAGADYDLGNCWTVGFDVKFQDWRATRHGGSHFDFSNNSDDSYGPCGDARQTEKWHSYAVNLTVGHHF